jgi:hypothetical protein
MARPSNRFRTRLTPPTRTAVIAAAVGLIAATTRARSADRKDKRKPTDVDEPDPENRKYDLEERQIGVEERRLGLLRQKVYMVLTVLAFASSITFALLGIHPQATAIAGSAAGALAGAGAFFEGRRAKRHSDDD